MQRRPLFPGALLRGRTAFYPNAAPRRNLEGQSRPCAAARRAIRAGAGFNHGQSPLERLSKREFEVCRGLARGDSMRAIAARLNISPKTGCAYRGSIFGKLKAPSLPG